MFDYVCTSLTHIFAHTWKRKRETANVNNPKVFKCMCEGVMLSHRKCERKLKTIAT